MTLSLVRFIAREDIEAWLNNHWDEISPAVRKVMPFLKPSLVAWAANNSKDLSGVLCDCILKAFEAHTLGEN